MSLKNAKLLVLLALTLCATPVFAELPFITDDAEVEEYKHVEIFLFGSRIQTREGNEIALPTLVVNYGLLRDIELGVQFAVLTTHPKGGEDPHTIGITDSVIDLKWQILKETKYLPGIALSPTYVLPTGDQNRSLGNGKGWYFLPIWLEKTFSKWTVYGGGGYAVNTAKEMRNFWFGGMVIQRELNKNWTVGAEVYSQGAESDGLGAFTLLNLGGYYYFKESIALMFSAGNSVRGENNFTTLLGLQYEFGGK